MTVHDTLTRRPTVQRGLVEQDAATTWLSPAGGLWVATRRGEHAGRVERVDGRYLALGSDGSELGIHDGLTTAMQAVDGIGDAPGPDVTIATRLAIGANIVGAVIVVLLGIALIVR